MTEQGHLTWRQVPLKHYCNSFIDPLHSRDYCTRGLFHSRDFGFVIVGKAQALVIAMTMASCYSVVLVIHGGMS